MFHVEQCNRESWLLSDKGAASVGDALQRGCKKLDVLQPLNHTAGTPAFLMQSRSVWPFGFVETSVDVAANDS